MEKTKKDRDVQLLELFDIDPDPDWCFLRNNFWEHLAKKFIKSDTSGNPYLCNHQIIREKDDRGPEIIASDLRRYWHYKSSWCILETMEVDDDAVWEEMCDDDIWGVSETYSEDLFSYCVTIKDSFEDLAYEIRARVFFRGFSELRKFTITDLNGVDEEAAKAIESWFILDGLRS